jgi:hypothetical protein
MTDDLTGIHNMNNAEHQRQEQNGKKEIGPASSYLFMIQ